MSAVDAALGKEGLEDGVTARLLAPKVGEFRASVQRGDAVEPGRVLGRMTVLGRSFPITAPAGSRGVVRSLSGAGPVEYGAELIVLGAASAAQEQEAESAESGVGGYPVKAPIDGIFYARPTPDAPPYVQVGATVSAGQTLGLIEVMKTFNPVTLGGPGAPSAGRVLETLATDGDEVAAGDVLLRIG